MYVTNTKTNFYPYDNNNYYPYKSYPGNEKVMRNSNCLDSQYYSDGSLNLVHSHINNNDILHKEQQPYSYDMNNTPSNSLYATTFNQNKNMSHNWNHKNDVFEKDISADNYRNNNNHRIIIKNSTQKMKNYNDEIGEVNDANYILNYEEENSDTSRSEGDTIINITYDDKSNEDDYVENSEQNVNSLKKIKRPKKKFMGKYFFSEIKKSFLSPLCICAPHPTLAVPNLNYFHYRIIEKTKGKKNEKPEIVVRY